MNGKRIDAGVDYLRVTSTDTGEKNKMAEQYEALRREDRDLGYKEYAGGAFGFMGRVTRHALCADKGEWRMFQVSGARAKRPFTVFSVHSQATRIDVQVTVQIEGVSIAEYMGMLHSRILARKRKEGKPAKVKFIQEDGEGQTIYIGKRASDWFFRIYDKFAESGKEEYRNCVRFELEIKGRASKGIWQHICLEGKGQAFLLAVLEQKFLEYDVEIPDREGWGTHEWRAPREKKAIESTMAWLEKAVAPSFTRAASDLGWIQPLVAILSDALYDWEVASIAHELAIVWGS